MEEHVFWAGSVFEDGMNGGNRATHVLSIQGHCDVDQRWVTGRGGITGGGRWTFGAIPVLGGFGEAGEISESGRWVAKSANGEAERKEKEKRKGKDG